MEVKEYCDSITAELSGWKSKMDHVVGNIDRASSDAKKQVMSEVNDLRKVSDELGHRIENLRKECPRDFK